LTAGKKIGAAGRAEARPRLNGLLGGLRLRVSFHDMRSEMRVHVGFAPKSQSPAVLGSECARWRGKIVRRCQQAGCRIVTQHVCKKGLHRRFAKRIVAVAFALNEQD
jgi:hypothetical protein